MTKSSPVVGAQPMTLRQAARALGFGEGRTPEARLRRLLLRRERITGEAILIRSGTEQLARFLVTLPVLRQHCPELFDTRVETEEMLREELEGIEQKLHRLERQDEALAQELLRQRGVTAATIRNKP